MYYYAIQRIKEETNQASRQPAPVAAAAAAAKRGREAQILRNMHTIKLHDERDSSHIFKASLDTGLAHHDRAL